MLKVTIVLISALALVLGKPELGFGSTKNLINRMFRNNPRIVGGTDAEEKEFPYQVSLQLKGLFGAGHYCGGSIIAPNVILTAGHCVTEVPLPPLTHVEVFAGIVSLSNHGANVQQSKVVASYVNPNYNGGVNPNDIALHVLETPLEFNDYVQPIALPQAGAEPTGDTILSGWGSTSNTQTPHYPDHLQKATLPIVDFKSCGDKLGASPLNEASNICTGPIDGELSACSGDSGGPLVQDVDGQRTIVGIVSWGEIPCGKGYPSVYTKVSNFIDFIQQVLDQSKKL